MQAEGSAVEVWEGALIAGGRALAGLTIAELARDAETTRRVLSEIESSSIVVVSPKRRPGCVSRDLWDRIITELGKRGVVLLKEDGGAGAGLRWSKPREARGDEDAKNSPTG